MKKILILIVLLFLNEERAFSSHFVGGEISYKSTSIPNVFIISAKLYSPCGWFCQCPVSICSINLSVRGVDSPYANQNFGTILINVVPNQSAYDVVQLCSSVSTICTNCGTRPAGTFTPAVEVYTFEGVQNFSYIPSGCCNISIGYSTCCRSVLNTTLSNPSSLSYYIESQLNRCVTFNNAPIFLNPLLIVTCAGQDVDYNDGVLNTDADSLSYNLGVGLSASGLPVPYLYPYSSQAPFPYLGIPGTSPPLVPPAGISVNALTGQLCFRPMGSFISNLVFEIKKWRYINGLPTHIGTIRRDLEIVSKICQNNANPYLRTYNNVNSLTGIQPNYDYVATAGNQLCFTVAADKIPAYVDTTFISWNIPEELDTAGLTITRLYNNATRNINGPMFDSIRVCWTPTLAKVRAQPYNFFINAKDNFCPIEGKIYKIFSIKVNSTVPVKLTKFTASFIESNVILRWQTAQEINNKGFFVERSIDLINWTEMGFVNGSGNSNSIKEYLFVTELGKELLATSNIYYRLKQIDFDAKVEYSHIVSINTKEHNEISLFPNPTNGIINVNFSNSNKNIVEIYNLEGRMIYKKSFEGLTSGTVKIDEPSGLYLINVNNDFERQTFKVLKE